MWIRRTISKIRYWYSRTFYPDNTCLIERMGKVDAFDAKLFKASDNPNPYTYSLRVAYPSVDIYNRELRWLNHQMTTDDALPSDWCRYKYRDVSLHAFLVDEKGVYLDPVAVLQTFRENVIIFLQRLDKLEEHQTGNAGHNARVLDKFRRHLLDVLHALILYTHHEQTQ